MPPAAASGADPSHGPPSLSEQELVDCMVPNKTTGVGTGCHGGWPYKAMTYAAKHDMCSEETYPYTAKDGIEPDTDTKPPPVPNPNISPHEQKKFGENCPAPETLKLRSGAKVMLNLGLCAAVPVAMALSPSVSHTPVDLATGAPMAAAPALMLGAMTALAGWRSES